MTERQEQLLFSIIEEHIKSATPVGSKLLESKGEFDLSSATIRNEMAVLEEEELIEQPFTSAGRIPTAKGYRKYLAKVLAEKLPELGKSELQIIEQVRHLIGNKDQELLVKSLAKVVAEMSQSAVFLGLTPTNFYYTGLTHLLTQPEFADFDRVCSLAKVVDHLDGFIAQAFNQVKDVTVYIADEAPLSDDCSLIVCSISITSFPSLFGILGPLRMDYRKNLSLISEIKKLTN